MAASQPHQGRMWKVLDWNNRGINSNKKWNAIRNKIGETNCDIICLQETKRETFDLCYIKNFCPPRFDKFEFMPSVGNSRDASQSGKAQNFMEFWISLMNMACQLNYNCITLISPGF